MVGWNRWQSLFLPCSSHLFEIHQPPIQLAAQPLRVSVWIGRVTLNFIILPKAGAKLRLELPTIRQLQMRLFAWRRHAKSGSLMVPLVDFRERVTNIGIAHLLAAFEHGVLRGILADMHYFGARHPIHGLSEFAPRERAIRLHR